MTTEGATIRKVKYRPGMTTCAGCRGMVPYDELWTITDLGRRPTIQRCNECSWKIVERLLKPNPVKAVKQILDPPPGGPVNATPEQEAIPNV